MVGNPTRVGAARVGDAVTCSGPDGKPYRCRVVERRLARGRSAALASGSLASGGRAGGAAVYEFYVHYDGMNGRMNGWVTEDQLVRGPPAPLTACTPGGEAAPPCAPLISLARGSVAESAAATTSAAEAGGGRPRAEPAEGALLSPAPGTRRMKRRLDELHRASASEPLLDPAEARERADEKAKTRHIRRIVLGPYEIETLYFSPYPDEFGRQPLLFICEHSLKYFTKRRTYERQLAECARRSPPGVQIYAAPAPRASSLPGLAPPCGLTVWEVDGRAHRLYCQCLCLLAKLFLEHKTLQYDTDPFLFYVLCELDGAGSQRPVGYFSKEKACAHGHTLACILVLPPHQRKGYGKLLIGLAYELARREGVPGGPERPLSELGQISFRSYWAQELLAALSEHGCALSVERLSSLTAICRDDVLATLRNLGAVTYDRGQYTLSITPKALAKRVLQSPRRQLAVDRALLRWSPPPPLLSPGAKGGGGGGSTPRADADNVTPGGNEPGGIRGGDDGFGGAASTPAPAPGARRRGAPLAQSVPASVARTAHALRSLV